MRSLVASECAASLLTESGRASRHGEAARAGLACSYRGWAAALVLVSIGGT